MLGANVYIHLPVNATAQGQTDVPHLLVPCAHGLLDLSRVCSETSAPGHAPHKFRPALVHTDKPLHARLLVFQILHHFTKNVHLLGVLFLLLVRPRLPLLVIQDQLGLRENVHPREMVELHSLELLCKRPMGNVRRYRDELVRHRDHCIHPILDRDVGISPDLFFINRLVAGLRFQERRPSGLASPDGHDTVGTVGAATIP